MTSQEIEQALRAPFPSKDIEWVVSATFNEKQNGIIAPYVSSRAIQKRLDSVFGVDGWSSECQAVPEVGVLCTISFKNENGDMVKKTDGAGFTKIEPLKGGISGALKRAASLMGIGRYLYDLPIVKVELDRGRFKGNVILPDAFVPEEDQAGISEVKVEYKQTHKKQPNTMPKGELTPEVQAALDYVVHDDKYNSGKKMSEVWNNSLKFLAHGKDEEQANAAKIVAQYKGVSI